jgi:predicted nuclease with TOPRIM domain
MTKKNKLLDELTVEMKERGRLRGEVAELEAETQSLHYRIMQLLNSDTGGEESLIRTTDKARHTLGRLAEVRGDLAATEASIQIMKAYLEYDNEYN